MRYAINFLSRSVLTICALSVSAAGDSYVRADVTLPNIFSDHMVLQRDQENKFWGRAEPGESVSVEVQGQKVSATADASGNWSVSLPKLSVGEPFEISVSGKNKLTIKDVLVGEVWICSGQSNMQWSVGQSNDADLEKLAANFPKIRMVNYMQKGTQTPEWSHDGRGWNVASGETVGGFSAVGYFFARQLHETLGVPVGMINNAWGGSACEAWIDRSVLAKDGKYDELLERWAGTEKEFDELSKVSDATEDQKKKLNALRGQLSGNQRPGNIYNGVLKSHLGYGIRGAIWYQGESNAGRAYQYRDLFPLMISQWRQEWGQEFPFYWVQLADFMAETDVPGPSNWAELREAQTMTMAKLPKTGQAVIIDIGEGKDIHPKNKVDVAKRLARWALANEYGVQVPFRSPQYKSIEVDGSNAVVKFDYVDKGWRPFDVAEARGFEIAGEDQKFVWAKADIRPDGSIVVSSPEVSKPVAVRYAWSNNPKCNMYSQTGLPLTPFRTDDWPGVTANVKK